MKPKLGYEALRRFRISQPHTSYFITMATEDRATNLAGEEVAPALRDQANAIETDGHWRVRGAVIMPDHLHLLVVLQDQLPLGRILARFKSKTRGTLAALQLRWQGNYYEHRLRSNEAVEPILLYIFLNPYRASLVTPSGTYRWFWLGEEEAGWFKPKLDEERPLPDWLR